MKKFLAYAFALGLAHSAHAIILYGTGDPEANTTAPTQPDLVDSGWQYQGFWGAFTGTPISSNCFLAAKHVGGSTNQTFTFRGSNYVVVACTDIGVNIDLNVWRVDGTFPAWAPLYERGDEIGKLAMWMGRGTQRGREVWTTCVTTNLPPPSALRLTAEGFTAAGFTKSGMTASGMTASGFTHPPVVSIVSTNTWLAGWAWGPGDSRMRWGTNVMAYGDFSRYCGKFAATGPFNCAVSSGDSSGGVYIRDLDGQWKLAGIIAGVSYHGPYGESTNTTTVGAFLDPRGLYSPVGHMSCTYAYNSTRSSITRVYSYLSAIKQAAGL